MHDGDGKTDGLGRCSGAPPILELGRCRCRWSSRRLARLAALGNSEASFLINNIIKKTLHKKIAQRTYAQEDPNSAIHA